MASDLHQTRSDHWEAVRLAWKSLHIPVGTLLIGSLLLAGVLSALAGVWGLGPVNAVP
jgi:hypothetical protein